MKVRPSCSRPAISGFRWVPVRGMSAERPTSVLNCRALRRMFAGIIASDWTLQIAQTMRRPGKPRVTAFLDLLWRVSLNQSGQRRG